MTSRGDPEHAKIEITEQSTYGKEDNGSLDEPLRLVSRTNSPMECSYLDMRKAYLVSVAMLKPLSKESSVLDSRSLEVLLERTATPTEAFDHDVYRAKLAKTLRRSYRPLTAIDDRGPPPRRGALVRYGRNPRIQTLDTFHHPCCSGVFLVASARHSRTSGVVWAYPVRVYSSSPSSLSLVYLNRVG